MFHPATVIQLYCAFNCKSGSDALNIDSTQSERAKTARDVPSVTQRRVLFLSLGINNRINMPSSGKKVSNVSGCKKKFMFDPLCARMSERLFQNQIPKNKDNTQ